MWRLLPYLSWGAHDVGAVATSLVCAIYMKDSSLKPQLLEVEY